MESKSPDDDVFKFLSLEYAKRNPIMAREKNCEEDNFPKGITNGAFWYNVDGLFVFLLPVDEEVVPLPLWF